MTLGCRVASKSPAGCAHEAGTGIQGKSRSRYLSTRRRNKAERDPARPGTQPPTTHIRNMIEERHEQPAQSHP